MRILQAIDRLIDKATNQITISVSNILLVVMSVLVFVEVLTRYVFGFAHGQVQEYCVMFFLWVVFLMAGKVTREKRHIIIGLLPEKLEIAGKLRAKAALEIYISLTLMAVGALFVYVGLLDTATYKATGYQSALPYVPRYWIWHLALPVGGVSLFYYGIREMIKGIVQLHHTSLLRRIESK